MELEGKKVEMGTVLYRAYADKGDEGTCVKDYTVYEVNVRCKNLAKKTFVTTIGLGHAGNIKARICSEIDSNSVWNDSIEYYSLTKKGAVEKLLAQVEDDSKKKVDNIKKLLKLIS